MTVSNIDRVADNSKTDLLKVLQFLKKRAESNCQNRRFYYRKCFKTYTTYTKEKFKISQDKIGRTFVLRAYEYFSCLKKKRFKNN